MLGIAALLACFGCSHKAAPVLPLAAPTFGRSVQADGSVQAVLSTPEYRHAVRFFARKDYRQALSLVDRLLDDPHFRQDSAGSGFLRSQQAICQHALGLSTSNPQGRGPHATKSHAPGPQANLTTSLTHPGSSPALRPSRVDVAPRVACPPAVPADCGPRAMLLACQTLGRPATLQELRRQAGTTSSGTSLQGLALAARAHGLKAKGVQLDLPTLERLTPPAIAWVDGNHYVALLSVEGGQATIHDPNHESEEVISTRELLQRSGGILLTLAR